MSNNLFKQVTELIKSTTAQSPNANTMIVSPTPMGAYPIAPVVGTMDNSVYQELQSIKSQLSILMNRTNNQKNYVIGGLDVFAYQGTQVAVTEGNAMITTGMRNYPKSLITTIPESNAINTLININTDTLGTRYVVINASTGNIEIANSYTYIDIPLAKIMINVVGGNITNDANDTFTNNYIVSGKDLAFDNAMALDDETKFLIKDAVKDILAENIFGTMMLNESLKIENQQGSVKLDSSSLKILDGGALTAQFNRNGTYFYGASGAVVSQYTKNGATVGNIAVTPNSIQSVNYQSGQRGFKLDDAGNAEFNRVSVRGHIGAYSGTIGNWVIGRDRLTNRADTTGLAPKDYPFYAGQTFANRASAPFRVSASGAVWATNAVISGTVTAALGNIGGWTISANKLSGGTTILYASGLIKCSRAQISGYISARSGLIGGWKLGANTISSTNGKLVLLATGSGEIRVGTASSSIRILGGSTATIQSSNYSNSVVNPKGFKFSNDGTLEAVDGVFRGKLVGNVFVKNEVNVAGGSIVLTTSTRLNMVSGLTAAATTIIVESGVFLNNDIIKIGAGSELLRVTAGSGSTSLTVSRGYNGTTPATANNKSTVYKVGVYNTLNKGYIELLGESNVIKIHRVNDVTGTLTDTVVTELGLMTQGTKVGQFGLYAGTASISGNIRAASGTIGGWTIAADRITGGFTTLYASGEIRCSNAIISGSVTGTAGKIGGWSMFANRLSGGTTILYASGLIRCSNANISGTITATAGKVGGWNIYSNKISGSTTVLYASGLIKCSKAQISGYISARSGLIGGWKLSTTKLSAGTTILYASGLIRCSNVNISGTVTAGAGRVGGWTLGATTMYNNSLTFNNAGTISGGTGNDIFKFSSVDGTYRAWIGNATAANAPFSVTKAGVLKASNATISGTITATTGAIGKWTVTSAGTISGYGNASGSVTLRSSGYFSIYRMGTMLSATQPSALKIIRNATGGTVNTFTAIDTKTFGAPRQIGNNNIVYVPGTSGVYGYGITGQVYAAKGSAVGVFGLAAATAAATLYGGMFLIDSAANTTTNYGIYTKCIGGTGAGTNTGVYAFASGNGDVLYGIYGKALPSAGNTAYGVYGITTGNGTTGTNYGGYFYASGACDTTCGVYAKADAGTGNTAYGVYAVASGAGNKYAGYFVGDVKIDGISIIDEQRSFYDSTNLLSTWKHIEIGDWNMDTTATVSVAHGLGLNGSWKGIMYVGICIRNDANDTYYTTPVMGTTYVELGVESIDATNIVLSRRGTGIFDNTNFNATSYNRGYLIVRYTPSPAWA